MTDYSALRRLAHEASETEMDWLDRDWLSGIMADDWADYVAAIDPQVVIDLIDENERLDRESQNLSDQLGSCDRERRQIKAENEALRKQIDGMRAALESAAKGIRWLQASVPMSLRISKRASKDYNAAKRAALQAKP